LLRKRIIKHGIIISLYYGQHILLSALRILHLDADGRGILKWILKEWGYRLDWSGSGQGLLAGYRERGNEPEGSLEIPEFLD
jgi:hypothetical protein